MPLTQTAQFIWWTLLVLLSQVALCADARCEEPWGEAMNPWQSTVLPRDILYQYDHSNPDSLGLNRASHSWLFRMPLPNSCSVLGLDADDDSSIEAQLDAAATAAEMNANGPFQLSLGADNPFLDFRRPGDAGGAGYYKLYSQYALLDTTNAGLRVGLQAVSPAGLECDGVASGPTILSPNLAWSYDLTDTTALHAFVSKNLHPSWRMGDSMQHGLNYGLALESPCPWVASTPTRGAHLFIEALSEPRSFDGQRSPWNWDLIPGIHWRLADNWWVTSGILMPLTSPRLDSRLWQITCSLQF